MTSRVVSNVLLLVGLLVAFSLGRLVQQELDQRSGPDCQEDEVLYPLDFTGPGDNAFSDYRCVHIDSLQDGLAND